MAYIVVCPAAGGKKFLPGPKAFCRYAIRHETNRCYNGSIFVNPVAVAARMSKMVMAGLGRRPESRHPDRLPRFFLFSGNGYREPDMPLQSLRKLSILLHYCRDLQVKHTDNSAVIKAADYALQKGPLRLLVLELLKRHEGDPNFDISVFELDPRDRKRNSTPFERGLYPDAENEIKREKFGPRYRDREKFHHAIFSVIGEGNPNSSFETWDSLDSIGDAELPLSEVYERIVRAMGVCIDAIVKETNKEPPWGMRRNLIPCGETEHEDYMTTRDQIICCYNLHQPAAGSICDPREAEESFPDPIPCPKTSPADADGKGGRKIILQYSDDKWLFYGKAFQTDGESFRPMMRKVLDLLIDSAGKHRTVNSIAKKCGAALTTTSIHINRISTFLRRAVRDFIADGGNLGITDSDRAIKEYVKDNLLLRKGTNSKVSYCLNLEGNQKAGFRIKKAPARTAKPGKKTKVKKKTKKTKKK